MYITLGKGRLIDYSKRRCRLGGLLAAAIHNMDGIGGRPGWAWIFILEGLFTILVACVSPWVLQDFPESAKFLTEAERMYLPTPTFHMNATLTRTYVGVYIIRELKADMQFTAEGEKFKLEYLWQCLTDRKTYATCRSLLPKLDFLLTMLPCSQSECAWDGMYRVVQVLGACSTANSFKVMPPYSRSRYSCLQSSIR